MGEVPSQLQQVSTSLPIDAQQFHFEKRMAFLELDLAGYGSHTRPPLSLSAVESCQRQSSSTHTIFYPSSPSFKHSIAPPPLINSFRCQRTVSSSAHWRPPVFNAFRRALANRTRVAIGAIAGAAAAIALTSFVVPALSIAASIAAVGEFPSQALAEEASDPSELQYWAGYCG
jgi:hypothetical protein